MILLFDAQSVSLSCPRPIVLLYDALGQWEIEEQPTPSSPDLLGSFAMWRAFAVPRIAFLIADVFQGGEAMTFEVTSTRSQAQVIPLEDGLTSAHRLDSIADILATIALRAMKYSKGQ